MSTIRAELILHNGTIRTMDPLRPTAEAVAIAGGRISAVGLLEEIEATAHANTKRIDLAGRTLLPGFNDAHGNLVKAGLQVNGVVEASANESDLEAAILAASKSMLHLGITNVTEAGLTPPQLEAYRKLAADRRLPFRINAMALRYDSFGGKIPLPERFESNWLRIDTVLVAAERDGNLLYSDDKMQAIIWDIHRAGLRAAIQATSEAAISQAIGAIEYAAHRLISRLKHRIEGFAHPTPDHLRRCQNKIGIALIPSETNGLAPLQSALGARLNFALGSGVSQLPDANPLHGIKIAANAPEQAISVPECLLLYTLGGAVVAGEDQLKGTIAPGKYADLTILSGDPLRAPLERLTDLQVELVLVNGLVVYST